MSRPGDQLLVGQPGGTDGELDTALIELDSANKALEKAPKLVVVTPCIEQEAVVVNLVVPSVVVDQVEGFHHDQQFLPAQVTLRIAESTGNPAYNGTGTATVTEGNGALFSDSNCLVPLVQPLSAAALTQGEPVYVKGGDTGPIVVKLTITDPGNPLIHVIPSATGSVLISPVNVVTPSVVIDQAEGFVGEKQFKPAQVTLKLVESTGRPTYGGTGTATVTEGEATLFGDEHCKLPLVQPISAVDLLKGVPAYVKGAEPGKVTICLALSDPGDLRIRVVPQAQDSVTISPVNIVTPSVNVDEAEGFFHAQQFLAAQVTLKIEQSTGNPAYEGTGTATVTEGNAALFSDAQCKKPLVQPLSATNLLKGVPAYIKGGDTGKVAVCLALTDPGDVRIQVVPQDEGSVIISPVNLITPSVKVDEAEGFFHAQQFHPALVTLKIEQSTGGPAYKGTGTATVTEGKATLFSDALCKTPLKQPLPAEDLLKGAPAYIKGGNKGKVTVRLALTESPDLRLRVVPRASDSVQILAVNVVTPSVTVDVAEGFHHAQQFLAAKVTLKITESTGNPAYDGTGSAAVTAGDATLFSDALCNKPLDQPFSATDLLQGVTAYVKGGQTGNVSVRLTLSDSPNPRIRAVKQDTDRVTISPVNVITPVLTGDELVLVHDGLNGPWATTLSELRVSFVQSNPGRSPPNLAVRVTYGNQIACFENANQTTAFNTNSSLARARLNAPFPLHVRGAAQGDCTVTATATGTAKPAWMFAPAVTKNLRVEQLTVDAYQYRDGLVVGGGGANIAGGGPPKQRELHERNGTVFTFARFVMRRPNVAFWTKANRITLTAHQTVQIFSDQAATVPLNQLVQGDFALGDKEFWVRSTNVARGLTPEPGHGVGLNWHAWAAHAPVQENLVCCVSCGATDSTTNKDLRLGDLVRVDTFSLDRTLDRQVRNECGNRVIGNVGDLQRNSALSRVQAHKYYGYQSAPWVNHYYRANGSSPFDAFIDYINNSHIVPQRPTRGANFIENHLWGQHGIQLAPAMKTRIRNYITIVLGAGHGYGADFGFQRLYGLPGTHAECLAANELVLAGVAPADITVATYMLQAQNGRQGKRFIACPNCQGVLNGGFRVITG